MSDKPADEGQGLNESGSSLAIAMSLGISFGAAVGSIIFAMTGEVLWIALAPGFGLVPGLIVHLIRAEGQSDN